MKRHFFLEKKVPNSSGYEDHDFWGIGQGAKTWSPSWLHASRNCPLRRVHNLGNPSILWPVAWFKKQGGWCGKVLKTNIFFCIRCCCNSSSSLACLICPHPRARLALWVEVREWTKQLILWCFILIWQNDMRAIKAAGDGLAPPYKLLRLTLLT